MIIPPICRGLATVKTVSAKQRLDTGHELCHIERLGNVVIGPQIEAFDAVVDGIPGRDNHNGRLGFALFHSAHHLQTGSAGQIQVYYEQVIIVEQSTSPGPLAGWRRFRKRSPAGPASAESVAEAGYGLR